MTKLFRLNPNGHIYFVFGSAENFLMNRFFVCFSNGLLFLDPCSHVHATLSPVYIPCCAQAAFVAPDSSFSTVASTEFADLMPSHRHINTHTYIYKAIKNSSHQAMGHTFLLTQSRTMGCCCHFPFYLRTSTEKLTTVSIKCLPLPLRRTYRSTPHIICVSELASLVVI